jgi:subtilisin family serine protease
MHPAGYCQRRTLRLVRVSPRQAVAAAFSATCALGAVLAPGASAGATPELEQALQRALPLQRVPIVATLTDQAELAPGQSPPAILTALRRQADLSQPGLLARLGLTDVRRYWLVNAISTSAIPLEVRLIAADPAVARVDLDPAVRLAAEATPPRRLFQAGPRNWGLAAIRAPQAWRQVGATGAAVTIGTIDTGVDARHPALSGKVVAWRDTVAGRAAPYDDHRARNAHRRDAGGGSPAAALGVAPGAKLLVAKAIPGSGVGSGSDIMAAAQWLADPDDNPATPDFPQVISNSWGEVADANDPWFRPLLRHWRALGIVPVFAAGNTGPSGGSVGSPSSYPDALTVGAMDQSRRIAPFSSRGPVAWQNRDGLGPAAGAISKPDIAGPGVAVVSSAPGGGYQPYSGTSMAAPHVAGVVALMRSANRALTVADVEQILGSTAADIGAPGRDNEAGAGLVNALAAARAAARRPGGTPVVAPPRRALRKRSRPPAQVRLTVTQLRINRRIALTALDRVERLEARLGVPPTAPSPVTVAARVPIRRLSAEQMRLTQRIAQSALRRATAVQGHIRLQSQGASVAVLGRRTGSVRLTVRQLLINQRIAQAALRRVTRVERRAEAAGMVPSA